MKTDSVEIDIYKKLKDEIKSELREELKREIKDELLLEMKEQLNVLVKEEIDTLIFTERYFETRVISYIKSLCYNEIHYLRMLNNGMVKHGESLIEVPQWKSGVLFVKNNLNVNYADLYKQYTNCGMMECSFEDFEAVLDFKHDSGYINWKQKGRTTYTYVGIFDLYNDILSEDIFYFSEVKLERFLYFISNKFLIAGKVIEYKNLKNSFTKIKRKRMQS
ncbi:MAG: hypothetical protein ACOH1O_10570 [Flavobacterium sp.]